MVDPSEDDVIRHVREAVSRVTDLPQEVSVSPLVTEMGTSFFPMIEIGLASETIPYAELRETARLFEKKLESMPGISKVQRFGYRAREIKIEVAPDRMRHYVISLSNIMNAVKGRNMRAIGGFFESYTSEENIVTLAQFRDPMEVGDVIVKSTVHINEPRMLNP